VALTQWAAVVRISSEQLIDPLAAFDEPKDMITSMSMDSEVTVLVFIERILAMRHAGPIRNVLLLNYELPAGPLEVKPVSEKYVQQRLCCLVTIVCCW